MRAQRRERARTALLLAACLGLTGCWRPSADRDALLVASSWTAAERDALATAFRDWRSGRPDARPPSPRIVWLPLDRGDDPAGVLRRGGRAWGLRRPPDVVLGGPATSYVRASAEGRLVPIDRPGHPSWCVARRSPVGRAMSRQPRPRVGGALGARFEAELELALDDPRHDPITLAWMRGILGSDDWARGYARLVREAGQARLMGRWAGAALAAVGRGEAETAPATGPDASGLAGRVAFVSADDAAVLVEGVAIAREGAHPDLAQAFLAFLAERGEAEAPPPDRAEALDPDVEGMLADLLGATLVDARDELRTALAVLGRAGPRAARVARGELWMTQPPPWPPASVAKLGARDPSGALTQALAEQVAPDADVRAWLLRSWLGPERPIDGRWLAELARAADGRLVREPRFRAWLRAEWTAWARQRYRRVARKAGEPVP